MTYQDWLAIVPKEFTGDALWRMEVYRLALFAGDLAWHDVTRLIGGHALHDDASPYLADIPLTDVNELLTCVPMPPNNT